MSSTYTVSQAQAQLPKLLKQDAFTISRHGRMVGAFLSRARIEALVETAELLREPGFAKARREFESGKTRFYSIDEAFDEDHRPRRPKGKRLHRHAGA